MAVPLYLDEQQNTEEAIRQRMLDRVPPDVDKTEGSYAWDALAPVSMELVFVMLLAKYVVEMSFAQTSSDDYLTMRAEDQTLTDDHAEETVRNVLTALEKKYGAVIR